MACDKGDDGDDGDDSTTGMEATGTTDADADADSDSGGDGDDTDDTGDGDGEVDTGDGDTTGDGDGDDGACAENVGYGHPRVVGETVAHITGLTRDGEMFNTCDLDGKPIVFDMSALWCGPCHDMAAYMAGQGGNYPNVMPYIKTWVDEGAIEWVTIMAQDSSGQPSTPANVGSWEDMYPNENIIVITGTPEIEGYMINDHWPTIHVAWYDYTWLSLDMGDYIQPLIDLYNAA